RSASKLAAYPWAVGRLLAGASERARLRPTVGVSRPTGRAGPFDMLTSGARSCRSQAFHAVGAVVRNCTGFRDRQETSVQNSGERTRNPGRLGTIAPTSTGSRAA